MNHKQRFSLVAFLLMVTTSILCASDDAKKDIEVLQQHWNTVDSELTRKFPKVPYFNGELEQISNQWQELLENYQQVEADELKTINAFLKSFENKYGSTKEAVDQSIKEALGDGPHGNIGWTWFRLKETIEYLNAYNENMAASLAKTLNEDLKIANSLNPLYVDKKYLQMGVLVDVASAFDPDNAEVKKLSSIIKEKRKVANKKIAKKIDAATWEGHSKDFNGPGNPNKLAKAVETFIENLEENKDKKDHVIAVRISGPWKVAETTLLGAPVTYGLPVDVAFRLPDDPKTAKAISLTMITTEAQQKPPFDGNWVGDVWRVRTKNIHSANASSGPNFLFKFVLSAALILSGLLAIQPWIAQKNQKLAFSLEALSPFKSLIGVITLIVGVVLFILGILNPISDIFPQVAAIAIGALLGLELILKKSASTKAEDLVKKGEASVRKLAAFQIPLGFASLGLGFIHLILGGILFF